MICICIMQTALRRQIIFCSKVIQNVAKQSEPVYTQMTSNVNKKVKQIWQSEHCHASPNSPVTPLFLSTLHCDRIHSLKVHIRAFIVLYRPPVHWHGSEGSQVRSRAGISHKYTIVYNKLRVIWVRFDSVSQELWQYHSFYA